MSEQHHNSIQEAVLEKVRAGEVRRVPRAYFALRVISTVVVGLVLLVISAFLVSFIFFSLHESGEQFLIGFGVRGITVFLSLFPWALLGIDILLIVLLEWLLQGFKFAYRIPLLNIFAVIVVVSIVFGAILAVTPLHPALQHAADNDHLPLVGSAYQHVHDYHEDLGMSRGVVISTTTNSFVLKHDDKDRDHDDGTFTINIPEGSTLKVPAVGEHVLVFGSPEHGSIEAQNIQQFP